MIILGAFVIPILGAIIVVALFRRKVVLWEVGLPFGVCLLLILTFYFTRGFVGVSATEYWGGWVSEIRYYEDWNEYIHQTCSRTVNDGDGNSHTEYYDCSYVAFHGKEWHLIDSNGEDHDIRESYYNALVKKFGQRPSFKDLHRHYHTNDGDMYFVRWPMSQWETMEPVTTTHRYENRVQVSRSVFNYAKVSKAEREQYGLFDYPKIDGLYQPQLLGADGIAGSREAERILQVANARLGAAKQLRIFVLVFRDQPLEAGFLQEAYWVNGNKNEFVLCIGLGADGRAQWAHPFSWTDVEQLKTDAREYVGNRFIDNKEPFDLVAVCNWLETNLEERWVRRSFSDFSYLKIEPPLWYVLLAYFLTTVAYVGIAFWTVVNEITEEDETRRSAMRRQYQSWRIRRQTF